MEDVAKLVSMMKDEWGVLSLTDLVFNHTANESPWLQEHPECSYNMINSPHLKPAYLVDRILWHFSLDVGAGKYEDKGVPAELRSEHHLQVVDDPQSYVNCFTLGVDFRSCWVVFIHVERASRWSFSSCEHKSDF